jgi:hypothetical protein
MHNNTRSLKDFSLKVAFNSLYLKFAHENRRTRHIKKAPHRRALQTYVYKYQKITPKLKAFSLGPLSSWKSSFKS